MTFTHLKAVVFDWAGTTVDHGSLAPMGVFIDVFRDFGVPITVEEARGPMGLPKLDHIRALGRVPRIARAWEEARGTPFDEAAAREVYEVFVPANRRVVADHAELIPGIAQTVATLRERGLKIGSTTGYTRDIMAILLPLAAEQGYAPDNLVCAGDLMEGRPTPLMMYRCFLDLEVWPASSVVKIDDTEPGILEGVAAGSWTVGVAMTGNLMGLTRDELAALEPEERQARRAAATARLEAVGAHAVVDSAVDLLPVLDAIDAQLVGGEQPAPLLQSSFPSWA